MMDLTENAALVSLKEWKAIREEVQKTIATLEDSLLASEEAQAAATFTQHPLA